MKSIHRTIATILAFVLLMGSYSGVQASTETAPAAVGAVYYVSQSGSGTACSSTSPCSLSTGMNKLAAGNTLSIVGTLTTSVTISKSGTATNRINITGGKIAASRSVMEALLVNGSNINISNLEVTGGASFGLRVKGRNITLKNVSVHDSVWENRIGDGCRTDTTGGWGRGLTFGPSASNVKVYGGSVYNNCGEGVGFTQNENSYISGTRIYDNFSRNIYIGNAANVTVENVVSYYSNPNFYRNGKPGRCIGLAIETTNYSTVGNMMHDTLIRGNTLTGCQGINFYAEVSDQYPRNVVVENNTFVQVPSPQVKIPGTNIMVRNNTILNNKTSVAKTFQDKSATFNYSSGWKTISTTTASGGTYHETTLKGASSRLVFYGTDLILVYKGGPSFGKMRVFIDGSQVAVINQYRAGSTYKLRWNYPGTLSNGRHVLTLVFAAASSTQKGSLDAVIVY